MNLSPGYQLLIGAGVILVGYLVYKNVTAPPPPAGSLPGYQPAGLAPLALPGQISPASQYNSLQTAAAVQVAQAAQAAPVDQIQAPGQLTQQPLQLF